MSCFQDPNCVFAGLDGGDKKVDVINNKVHDLRVFFYYSERDKEYFSITAAQFSNRMDFRGEGLGFLNTFRFTPHGPFFTVPAKMV